MEAVGVTSWHCGAGHCWYAPGIALLLYQYGGILGEKPWLFRLETKQVLPSTWLVYLVIAVLALC